MLMEEPFGFFGFLNPTGHDAIYFERICADTPVRLRRCSPGELGAVILNSFSVEAELDMIELEAENRSRW